MLTVKQAAQKLQCSAATVYQLCAAKMLRHARIGAGRGSIRIPEEAITEYLDRQMVAVSSPLSPPRPARPLKFLSLD
jgi:excisionase family DNA binding protein